MSCDGGVCDLAKNTSLATSGAVSRFGPVLLLNEASWNDTTTDEPLVQGLGLRVERVKMFCSTAGDVTDIPAKSGAVGVGGMERAAGAGGHGRSLVL
jgi:hypothetical protein